MPTEGYTSVTIEEDAGKKLEQVRRKLGERSLAATVKVLVEEKHRELKISDED